MRAVGAADPEGLKGEGFPSSVEEGEVCSRMLGPGLL